MDNDQSLESFEEYIVQRRNARQERLRQLKSQGFSSIGATIVTDSLPSDRLPTESMDNKNKENTDKNETPMELSTSLDIKKSDIIKANRAKKFEDIKNRALDFDDFQKPTQNYSQNKSPLKKSPLKNVTTTTTNTSPQKNSALKFVSTTATLNISPVKKSTWGNVSSTSSAAKVSPLQESPLKNVSSTAKSASPKVAQNFGLKATNPTSTVNATIRPDGNSKPLAKKKEEPKLLTEFFDKVTNEEIVATKGKTYHDTLQMFKKLDDGLSPRTKTVDPAELPLAARRALFENAFKEPDAKKPKRVGHLEPQKLPAFQEKFGACHEVQTPTPPKPEVTSSCIQTIQRLTTVTPTEGETKPEASESSKVLEPPVETSISYADEDTEELGISSTGQGGQVNNLSKVPSCQSKADQEEALAAFDEINDLSCTVSAQDISYDKPSEVDVSSPTKKCSRIYPELPSFNDSESIVFDEMGHSSPTTSTRETPGVIESKQKMINQISPIKKALCNIPASGTPPVRTLSMYRREQKLRSLQCTPTTNAEEIICKEKEKQRSKDRQKMLAKLESLQKECVEQQLPIIAQTTTALNVIDQSGEFLHSKQHIEAERILLVATQKHIRGVNEIEKLKQSIKRNDFGVEAAVGCVTISNILLRVKGDFFVSQVGGHDKFSHHFLCMAHWEGKILTTEMLDSSNAIENACLQFHTPIKIEDLRSGFNIRLEFYGLSFPKENANAEKRFLKREHNKSIKLTPKRKAKAVSSAVSSPGGPGAVKSSNFTRLGFVEINIKSCSKKRHTLQDFYFDSPLEGSVEFETQLGAEYSISMSNYLNFNEESGGYTVWNKRWCVLKGYLLAYWRFAEDETRKESLGVIDLRKCVNPQISPVPYDICARKNTFMLLTVDSEDCDSRSKPVTRKCYKTMTTSKHLLSADLKEECELWCYKLNEALKSVRLWEPDALQPYDSAHYNSLVK